MYINVKAALRQRDSSDFESIELIKTTTDLERYFKEPADGAEVGLIDIQQGMLTRPLNISWGRPAMPFKGRDALEVTRAL